MNINEEQEKSFHSLIEINLENQLVKCADKSYEFEIDPEIFPAEWRKEVRSDVNRRLGYLLPGYGNE